jgi:protein transport protein SEC61 subunit gamma-like protein
MVNAKQMLKDMVNTIKLAKKSDKDDYMQHLRLVLLGMGVVGGIGFIIQFTFAVINLGHR